MKIQNPHSILAAGMGALILGLWFFALWNGYEEGDRSALLFGAIAFFATLFVVPASFVFSLDELRRARREGRVAVAPVLALLLNTAVLGIVTLGVLG